MVKISSESETMAKQLEYDDPDALNDSNLSSMEKDFIDVKKKDPH